MSVKVSIVVPCYNVENFIDKCLESITNQTHRNIEIICVNDGSSDKTINKLNLWTEKDGRIKVINKANGGLSDARNSAKKHCNGEFVTFIDSDDWISLDYIESAIDKYKDGIILVSQLKTVPGKMKKTRRKYNKKNMYRICRANSAGKFYRLSEWEHEFKKGLIFEDEAHSPILYKKFNSAESFDGVYYHRQDNSNSITKTKWPLNRYIDTLNEIKDTCNFKYAEIRILYFSLKTFKEYPDTYKEFLRNKEIKRILRKYWSPKILVLRIMLLLGMKKTIRKLI